jgi:DNA-binding NarL/FixJ family response regulator
MKKRVGILIIDDHQLFRESLSRLIEGDTGYTIVGTCGSVQEALLVVDRVSADVVLLDYDLRGESGIQFLQAMQHRPLPCRVLMLTSGMTEADVRYAMDLGAAGIFLKNSPMAELVHAIRRVSEGEPWLDSGMVRAIMQVGSGTAKGREPQAEPGRASLSPRESNVLRGVFEGLSNKEIAHKMSISEGTVKAVLQQLFARTGVRTRSQLVRIAVEQYSKVWLNSD